MIVVDASALLPALADDDTSGDIARGRLHDSSIAAPELIDLEVLSVLRRRVGAGQLPLPRAEAALVDLRHMRIAYASHRPLLRRAWELRHTVSSYDASYVALAESLGVTLVTADARLARAPGIRCDVEVLG